MRIFVDQCSTINIHIDQSIKIAKQQVQKQFLHSSRKTFD